MALRLAQPDSDFPRIAELLSLEAVEPVTAESLHEDEARVLPGKFWQRWVYEVDGEIQGYAMVIKYPSQPADVFNLEVVVDPAHRQRGIGTQLYHAAVAFAESHHAGRLFTELRDHQPEALAFAQKRGFIISHHVYDSVLDAAAFEQSDFEGVIEAVEQSGVRFMTLAEIGSTPETKHKLYELNRMASLDEPGSLGTFPTYENWLRIVLGGSWYRPESQFIALDGDNFIGLAGVYNDPGSPQTMFNGITGVEPAYRGRKIALALKLLTIRYARTHSAKTISTGNDARNQPMLAINHKLGYQSLPGHYVVVKRF